MKECKKCGWAHYDAYDSIDYNVEQWEEKYVTETKTDCPTCGAALTRATERACRCGKIHQGHTDCADCRTTHRIEQDQKKKCRKRQLCTLCGGAIENDRCSLCGVKPCRAKAFQESLQSNTNEGEPAP